LNNYLDELDKTGMSLMIYRDGELIFQSRSKGIRPHLEAIEKHGNTLNGTVMVDKIVGRAAALLLLYAKPKEAYAALVSKPGKQVLMEHGLNFAFRDETDHITHQDEGWKDILPIRKNGTGNQRPRGSLSRYSGEDEGSEFSLTSFFMSKIAGNAPAFKAAPNKNMLVKGIID